MIFIHLIKEAIKTFGRDERMKVLCFIAQINHIITKASFCMNILAVDGWSDGWILILSLINEIRAM